MALTLSKDELVKLYVLLTGESKRVFENVFTEDQALAIANSISEAISSASDLTTDAQIIAAAAAKTPATVYTGAPGIAKLVAWAVADHLAAIAAGTGGLAEIKAYVAANTAAIVADSAVHTALEGAGWSHA
jgi:hypothetical protein